MRPEKFENTPNEPEANQNPADTLDHSQHELNRGDQTYYGSQKGNKS